MSSTSSPARPVQSLSLVLVEENVGLQAFLAATKREAQEKWEKLRAVKTSEVEEKVAGPGGEVFEAQEVVGKGIEEVVEVETEVVPKVEPRPRKVAIKMVAGLPRSCEVIPVSPLFNVLEVP
ncbi:hypothetical protein GGU10DRAFT_337600 [Lentinula aff. detonsa]|uniref:Uncharacterized protein n=1 Tax=Lentinula aff. detonsa TaxID=2804958 RepID=A0AA38K7H7_9AGAR|nr:hypothetical protein GGU10DRAFT_337600 [Lentinula aff. detonsa]